MRKAKISEMRKKNHEQYTKYKDRLVMLYLNKELFNIVENLRENESEKNNDVIRRILNEQR